MAFSLPTEQKYFSKVDSNGLPILDQKALDSVLAKTKSNYLPYDKYRENYNKFGWNIKSDSSFVKRGPAIVGLDMGQVSTGMGATTPGLIKAGTHTAATAADFKKAADQLGLNVADYTKPTKFVAAQGIYGATEAPNKNNSAMYTDPKTGQSYLARIDPKTKQFATSFDQNTFYNDISNKTKDLYLVGNALNFKGADKPSDHAAILFKADGSGNLVPTTKPDGTIQYTPYTGSTVHHGGASETFAAIAPVLGIAGMAFGLPAIFDAIGSAGVGAGTLTAAGQAAGLTAAEAASLPGIIAGGTGTMAGTTLGLGGQVLGSTAGIAGALQAANTLSNIGDITGALDYSQVAAAGEPATTGLTDVVPSSDLGTQQFPQTVNAVGEAGATAPTVPPLSATERAMQALGIGGNQQSALGNLINPAGSTSGGVNTALSNAALTSLLGSGAQAVGSYLSGQSQADAAKDAAAKQLAMFNTINNQLAPQRGAGYSALNQLRSMLPGQYTTYGETGQPTGTAQGTDYLTRQFTPQDLYAGLAPNYQFMLNQGQQAAQRQANLAGGAIGGNALRGLEDYTQNYAQNAYQPAFQNFQNQRTGIYNTLAGIAGLGQQAIGTGAQYGQAATTAQGQLGVGAAGAQAAGLTGASNALSGGLQNYQNNQLLQAILNQNQNVAQKPA